VIPSGEETAIEFGTAAQGGFAYSVLTPDIPGVGAVGVHFFQGDLRLLFYPTRFQSPEVYNRVTHDEFRNAVRGRYGFDIQGAQIG
jgi:hypothetical protein